LINLQNNSNKITAVLPCRKGSTRLGFDKQLSNFAGTTLLDIKVNQLLNAKHIDNIILSTDDYTIFNRYNNKKIKVVERDSNLLNVNDADSLVDVCLQHVSKGNVLITFCTNPFFNEYDSAIEKYYEEDCDSLLTARKVGSFIIDEENKIVNCDRKKEKWPRTQDLPSWFELDSCIEPIMSIDLMRSLHDRIGHRPYLYITDAIQSIDIDYKKEWDLAEKLWKALN